MVKPMEVEGLDCDRNFAVKSTLSWVKPKEMGGLGRDRHFGEVEVQVLRGVVLCEM